MGVNKLDNIPETINSVTNLISNATQSERELRQQYLSGIIDEINKSTKLGVFEKATISEAVIKQSKQLKKQNVEDILCKAITILKDKDISLLKGMENVHSNWLLEFFDNCENTTDGDMKNVWAKILAGECENPGSASKRLMLILKELDKKFAEKFGIICSHTVVVEPNCPDKSLLFIFPDLSDDSYDNNIINEFKNEIGLNISDMHSLTDIGLINYTISSYVYNASEAVLDYYGDKILITSNSNVISLGIYKYTMYGKELANILYKDMFDKKDDKYVDFIIEYLSKVEGNNVQRM